LQRYPAATRNEEAKRKTGRNLVFYTGPALHKKSILELGNGWLMVLWRLESRFALYSVTLRVRCNRVYEQRFVHPATSKMKNYFCQLAPVAALPCSKEERGSEA